MKIIPFKTNSPIETKLPNGSVFITDSDKIHHYFDNTLCLDDNHKDGLIKLALAVLFADHLKNQKNKIKQVK